MKAFVFTIPHLSAASDVVQAGMTALNVFRLLFGSSGCSGDCSMFDLVPARFLVLDNSQCNGLQNHRLPLKHAISFQTRDLGGNVGSWRPGAFLHFFARPRVVPADNRKHTEHVGPR